MKEAVKEFQKANGLKVVDGIITAQANTWKKLLKLL
jgi:peptidoglycan hydrolase-like protein with peptidoglycan-binding domain